MSPAPDEAGIQTDIAILSDLWTGLSEAEEAVHLAVRAVELHEGIDIPSDAELSMALADDATLLDTSEMTIDAAFDAAEQLYAEIGAANPRFKKLHEAWNAYRREETLWFRVNESQYDSYMAGRLGR